MFQNSPFKYIEKNVNNNTNTFNLMEGKNGGKINQITDRQHV